MRSYTRIWEVLIKVLRIRLPEQLNDTNQAADIIGTICITLIKLMISSEMTFQNLGGV